MRSAATSILCGSVRNGSKLRWLRRWPPGSNGSTSILTGMKTAADWWQGRVEVLLIEGVGGLLCPLTEDKTIADLAVALGYPLLVVARAGLGTINHALLTVEAARHRGLQVAGVVLNEAEPLEETPGTGENSAEIARRANVPVLGVVRYGSQFAESGKGRLASADWLNLMAAREPAPAVTGPRRI